MTVRSDLFFPNLVESFPNDDALLMTSWALVGAGHPTPGDGQIYSQHSFPGTSGYECFDVPLEYSGITSISVRCVVNPQWGTLNGAGRITLVARGSNSAVDLNLIHPWGFAIRVSGGSLVEMIGYYQDLSFVLNEIVIGSFSVPTHKEPITLGFTRSTSLGEGRWRAYLDGGLIGDFSGPLETASPPSTTILSIGYRDNNGTPTEFYDGAFEQIVIQDQESIDSEETAAYTAREQILFSIEELANQTFARLQDAARDTDSTYHNRIIRPWAFGLGDLRARLQARERNMIYRPFGSQLDYWLRAMGIDLTTQELSAEEKIDTLNALLADSGGLETLRLRQIVADLTKVDISDVSLFENRNEIEPPSISVSIEPLTGPWTIRGLGTIDSTPGLGSGIKLASKEGRTLKWEPVFDRALEARFPLAHLAYSDPSTIGPEEGTELFNIYGFGFSAIVGSLSGNLDATQWAGFTVTGRTSQNNPQGDPVEYRALHIGVYGTAPDFSLAWRESQGPNSRSEYTAWTVIGTVQVQQQLSIEYNDDSFGTTDPAFTVRVHRTANDTTDTIDEYPIDVTLPLVTSASLSLQSEGPLSGDVFSFWNGPKIHYRKSPVGRAYFLSSELAVVKNHSLHTSTIRANERPVAIGHVTYQDSLETDNTDGPLDYTRMDYLGNYPPALGASKPDATHNSGIVPYSLWTFQGPGPENKDRLGRETFTAGGAGAAILFEDLGPDGLDCVFVTEDDTENYLQLNHANSLDITPMSSVGFCMVYRWDSDNPTDDIVMQKQHSLSAKRIVLDITAGNFRLLGSDGIATTNSTQVGATSGAWDVLAFTVEDLGANSFRFTMANRTSSVTFTTAYGASLSINQPWEIGSSTGLMPARMRYRWLSAFVDSEASNLSGTDLEDVCNRVYGSIFGG